MLHFIYCQPLWRIELIMLLAAVVWAVVGRWCAKDEKKAKLWRIFNCVLVVAAVIAVLYTTLFVRTDGESAYGVALRPFKTFKTAQANPELYRTMLMNVFLFEPLGLGLSNAFAQKRPVWQRVLLTVMLCMLLSCAIEWVQYIKHLGWVETDDVLCNIFGAFLGALSVLGQKKFVKNK